MAPALLEGDVVCCRRTGPPFERGDCVVFAHPRRSGMRMIKRVIGLPGETIVIDTGTILIDGRGDQDHWGVGLTSTDGEWTVATDQIFVLSDNRTATRDDSRTFGPIDGRTSATGLVARPHWRRARSPQRPRAPTPVTLTRMSGPPPAPEYPNLARRLIWALGGLLVIGMVLVAVTLLGDGGGSIPTTSTTSPTTTLLAGETTTTASSTTTVGSSTTTTTDGSTTTTTSSTATTLVDPTASLILTGDGIGSLGFGVEADRVIAELDAVLGSSDEDSAWVDSFATFGTCPGTEAAPGSLGEPPGLLYKR